MDDEAIGKQIVDCAVKVHTALGAGLLESAYETCLAHELTKNGLEVKRQVPMPVLYDSTKLDVGYRIDMFVNDRVVVELKAVEKLLPLHTAQLLTYLKLSKLRLGFLLNFNVDHMRNGVRRVVNGF
ncbi:MAG: GxxExxY protein [Burkholderiales bacterium]